MKCFSCDALLTIPIKEDLKTGRCYCETCQLVIKDLYEVMFSLKEHDDEYDLSEVPNLDEDFDDIQLAFLFESTEEEHQSPLE